MNTQRRPLTARTLPRAAQSAYLAGLDTGVPPLDGRDDATWASGTERRSHVMRTTSAEVPKVSVSPRAVDRASWFFGALLTVNVALVVLYQLVTFRLEVHSDSAVKVLLADEVLRTGRLFPRDWVYANGDLYAFFTHTVALPFVALFGPGFLAHALAGLAISLGLMWSASGLLRELDTPRWQRLAVLALLASGISTQLAENLFGQATYGFIVAMNVARLALALIFVRRFDAGPWVRGVVLGTLGLLTVLNTWNNPKRGLVMFTLPFLVASGSALWRAVDGRWSLERLKRSPHAWLLAVHVLTYVVGALLADWVSGRVNGVDAAGGITWAHTHDGIFRNAVHAALGVLAQLGGVPAPQGSLRGELAGYEMLRVLTGLGLAWALGLGVRRAFGDAREPRGFVASFTVTSAVLSLTFFVFTTLPDSANPSASSRYLVPTLVIALFSLPAAFARVGAGGGPARHLPLLTVVLVACCGFSSLAMPGFSAAGSKWPDVRARGLRRQALAELLRAQGLRHGYATFWNAGALTLLSDGAVHVRQITGEPLPMPSRLHASNRWFRDGEHQGETFLLLTEPELKAIDRGRLEAVVGAPTRTLTHGEYRVLVFSKNLAEIPGWSDLMECRQRFDVTGTTAHRIGQLRTDEAGHSTLTANAGEKGDLLFGPFLWVAPGRYKVTFDLEVEGRDVAGLLQVTANKGETQLALVPLVPGPRGPRVLELETHTEEKFVEFRVVTTGVAAVTVHGTEIERVRRPAR